MIETSRLHIDIETYSSENLKDTGVYKYVESPDFEILLVSYISTKGFRGVIDLASGDTFENHPRFLEEFNNPLTEKHAFNANFERVVFNAVDMKRPVSEWRCTAVRSGILGRPLGLAEASKVFKLGDKSKLTNGKKLIRLFSMPNLSKKGYTRILPTDKPEQWAEFVEYCMQDTEAEYTIYEKTKNLQIPDFEQHLYCLDQDINDRGICADIVLVRSAAEMGQRYGIEQLDRLKRITELDNPNSVSQLKEWINSELDENLEKLDKNQVNRLLSQLDECTVSEVLNLRKRISKSSVKKYDRVIQGANSDGRLRGLFQFYGANRTGRWAGRRVQLQNLPKNSMRDISEARELVRQGRYEDVKFIYDNVSEVLSELIRTVLIAPEGKTFAVADFSAIEARVLAWLAGVEWRIKVFETHGKIYEASASKMFKVPLDKITYELRQKGKVAELALGYGGGPNALISMMGDKRTIPDDELPVLVNFFRESNPEIVDLWRSCNRCAVRAVSTGKDIKLKGFPGNIVFGMHEKDMFIQLPSGRRLYYAEARIVTNRFGSDSVSYKGLKQTTGVWMVQDTYGGKLVENIVQAIARDVLAESVVKLDATGFELCAHIHDEIIAEIKEGPDEKETLENFCNIMGSSVKWADGLPLRADGYTTKYYLKKD